MLRAEAVLEAREAFGDYWVKFAKSGDPNLSSRPEWPAFTAEDQRQVGLDLGPELGMSEIDRLAQYELVQRRLLRLIVGMKQLRQGELEIVAA